MAITLLLPIDFVAAMVGQVGGKDKNFSHYETESIEYPVFLLLSRARVRGNGRTAHGNERSARVASGAEAPKLPLDRRHLLAHRHKTAWGVTF